MALYASSNYDTIKIKDTPLEDTNQGVNIQPSTFLQSVLLNKLLVTLVIVVLGVGLMAYAATNPVATTTTSLLRLDGKGGGITGSGNGGDSLGTFEGSCYARFSF